MTVSRRHHAVSAVLGLAALLAAAAAMASECPPPPVGPTVLWVTSNDPDLRAQAGRVERHLRRAWASQLTFLAAEAARRAMTEESGRAQRATTVREAREQLTLAFGRFRELEDEAALALVADVTTRLSAVSQSPGAIQGLAEAHLLAGAIFLARNRVDAAQARLRRALQLDPDLIAPRERFSRRVRTELAALRDAPGPQGTLVVEVDGVVDARVYIDGRPQGPAPLRVELLAGRHLLRISATGWRSFHTTVYIEPGAVVQRQARLLLDEELAGLRDVARWLDEPLARAEAVASLSARTGARQALIVDLRLSERRGPTGTSTPSVTLHLAGHPRQTSTLDRESLQAALTALVDCRAGRGPPTQAPALVMWPNPDVQAEPYEPPAPWWTEPWVWAAFAIVAISAAGAVVAARNDEGPPDEVQITLVPRP